jgi:hypothetical protein
MAEKQGTIYQELNSFFNISGFEGQEKTNFKDGKSKIIIKGSTPEDVYRKGLEIQQKQALQDKFFKTTDRGFQKALQYEAARLPAYIDYEGMEYYPLIASALDLFMEESTTIGYNGKMLNITSDKERIKGILEEFFYDIINVNVNLPFWTRNLTKYGDNFVLLYGEKKKGITHVKQMVNYEIERFERIMDGKPTVRFKERMTGDEFNIFEIGHFRLLGDDKYLPYGSSTLNKIRRVFRQLIMAEDAMLTYRLVRAGEKKVFRIDVGNIDEDDIEEYVYKVATKFKKTPQVHPSDGQIDYRFNILGNDEDYFLPMRNANSQTGIDTLPGASNLGDIHDIEYLRDNLFMGLGVPKPFLSFQDAQGGGKNLAQFDMRFTKKINRIQQALIQELNKMAIIHLKLLGYDDRDLTNFTLTLTNPSTQSELMMSEVLREKAQTYTELTRADNGIAAMSHTKAKKLVFNMSESDILEDLKQQKMEMVVKQELQDSPVVIKRTGLFKDIDDMYGEPVEGQPLPSDQEGGDEGGMPPESSGIPPSGAPAGPPGGAPTGPPGGDAMGGGGGEIPGLSEGTLGGNLTMKQYEAHVNQLLYGEEKVKEKNIAVLLESKNKSLNERASTMMSEIDKLLENTTTINRKPTEDSNIDAVDFEDIENIDLEEK